MEFGFTAEQEKLRKDLHEFYTNEIPEDCDSSVPALDEALQSFWMALQKKAGAKGYLTPGWAKEYGGLGLGSIEQGIVNEEEAYAGVRWPAGVALHQLAPPLTLFGTEEQKKKFLPLIARGEAVWFQCFTEPEAGSDEANIQLRAVVDGDDYVLNGQKIFITGNHKPDYLYTEARTQDTVPRHRGLSLFLVPANKPGISFSPLPTMGGGLQNQVFFDDVRVSKDYLLGQLNRGFYHAMAAFEFERSGMGFPSRAKHLLQEFIQFCREEERGGKPLIDDPQVRDALAQMAVENEVWRLVAWHTQWWFGERQRLGAQRYDVTGYFWKVFTTRHAKMMMDIMGLYGQVCTGSKWAKLCGMIESNWQEARSMHGGATLEILKVVLAQRGLGLPRIPAQIMAEIGKAIKEAER